ncbi:MAG: hypothetical protein K6G03_05070 [Lachnospiraceae bacterium]|nr:hypothetical protein [Lachnospiraceae bacterium]
MRLDFKNPKFVIDTITLVLSVIIIALTVVVIFEGSRAILAVIFYLGAGLFTVKIIRGIMSRRVRALLYIIPVALCIASALMAQQIVPIPELPWN